MSPFDESLLYQKQFLRTSSRDTPSFLGTTPPKKEDPEEGYVGQQGNGVVPAMWTATATTEQPKQPTAARKQGEAELSQLLDFDLPAPMPEPPVEYMAGDLHGKTLVGDPAADVKRGILSSIRLL